MNKEELITMTKEQYLELIAKILDQMTDNEIIFLAEFLKKIFPNY